MGRIAEMVYVDLVARGRSISTAKSWRRFIERFENVAGVKEEYGRADVIAYIANCRERGINQNSINTELRPVKLLAQIQGWDFPNVPMSKVRNCDVKRPILSYDEVVGMIEKGKKVLSKRQIAYLALTTVYGLRRAEMANMSNEEVNSGETITVKTLKGGPTTTHQLPCEVRRYLKGFEPTDIRYMSKEFKSIFRKVGVKGKKGYGWHSIRRRLATELLLRGVSSTNVVRFMRWSDAWMKGEFRMLLLYADREQSCIDEEVFRAHPFLEFWSESSERKGECERSVAEGGL